MIAGEGVEIVNVGSSTRKFGVDQRRYVMKPGDVAPIEEYVTVSPNPHDNPTRVRPPSLLGMAGPDVVRVDSPEGKAFLASRKGSK